MLMMMWCLQGGQEILILIPFSDTRQTDVSHVECLIQNRCQNIKINNSSLIRPQREAGCHRSGWCPSWFCSPCRCLISAAQRFNLLWNSCWTHCKTPLCKGLITQESWILKQALWLLQMKCEGLVMSPNSSGCGDFFFWSRRGQGEENCSLNAKNLLHLAK